jgi:peptide/nickel transport system substrate-binding protein
MAMHRSLVRLTLVCALVAVTGSLIAACGSSSKKKGGATAASTVGSTAPGQQHKGGTLRIISNEDFDNIDPGLAYFQGSFEWLNATDRTLMSFMPGDATKEVPDLASAPPEISSDGKTVTVHIRHGVKFSPPVNREVTAADVKYAIERGFTKQVPNGYAGAYFGSLEGAPASPGDYKPIPGLQTPDKYTIVFKLTRPLGGLLAGALAMPLTAPVPKEYAQKYDAKTPSQYGMHQVATGPYMLPFKGGKVDYQAGRHIGFVRNPNWDPKTDFRPAYVDAIDWTIGADQTVAGRQILTGKDMISGDPPPASIVKQAATKSPNQIAFASAGNRYIALNTKIPPFNNENLRKAVSAATDKTALQLTRGGPVTGDIATHFLAPNNPGFAQAGGMKGPALDFETDGPAKPDVVKKYMAAAGFPSGKYHGPPILMVGDNAEPGSKTAQAFLQTLQNLGFSVKFRSVEHTTMLTQFCQRPSSNYNICPNVGWLPDFPDGQAVLDATFDGKRILQSNNSNFPLLNDPKINADMAKAAELVTPAERAAAWAKIDDEITATAGAIPWLWDKQANIESKGVHGVIAKWNSIWDLDFTSVK